MTTETYGLTERQSRYWLHVYDLWRARIADTVARKLADTAVRRASRYGYPRGF
jgi:hypothetical protein